MFSFLGLKINNISLIEFLAKVREIVALNKKNIVVTINPEIAVYASKQKKYLDILKQSDFIISDGVGIVLASYLFFQPISKGRVTGVDLTAELVKQSVDLGYTLYLIGYSNEQLQKATQYFAYKYGKNNIVGYKLGPIFTPDSTFPLDDKNNEDLLNDIKNKKPDVLLVGFGHPKQDFWLNYYLPELPIKLGIGIGGSLDYFAGLVPRSPRLLRWLGLEWLWRLLIQPWRIKRIFTAVFIFPVVVIREIVNKLFHVEQL